MNGLTWEKQGKERLAALWKVYRDTEGKINVSSTKVNAALGYVN